MKPVFKQLVKTRIDELLWEKCICLKSRVEAYQGVSVPCLNRFREGFNLIAIGAEVESCLPLEDMAFISIYEPLNRFHDV